VTTRRAARASTRWVLAFAAPIAPMVMLPILLQAQPSGASSPPALNVSPGGNYTNTQSISVSVGSNGYFTPHSRVNVLECSDAGGKTENLPKDDTTCDGNTIQGTSIIVGNDGSFSLSQYPVYLLPSSTLGEQSNFMPVCNQTNYCVLYVGQDQNDFTAPKVFSAPFLVTAGSGATTPTSSAPSGATTPTAGGGTAATTPGATTQAGGGAATVTGGSATSGGATGGNGTSTISSGALADTGLPAGIELVALCGAGLLLTGAVGRRLTLRARR
jgi:hypothetical protein